MSPDDGMAPRSFTFIPKTSDDRHVLQGRLYYTAGVHYWGNGTQGSNYLITDNDEDKKT